MLKILQGWHQIITHCLENAGVPMLKSQSKYAIFYTTIDLKMLAGSQMGEDIKLEMVVIRVTSKNELLKPYLVLPVRKHILRSLATKIGNFIT